MMHKWLTVPLVPRQQERQMSRSLHIASEDKYSGLPGENKQTNKKKKKEQLSE